MTVEYVELGTKHLHPQMLQDGVLRAAAPLKAAAGRDTISTSSFQDVTGRDPISSNPSQGCCRKGFCTQHLFSGMLQEGILCLASPLKDTAGRKDIPSLM